MGIETILFCFMADEEMYKVKDRFEQPVLRYRRRGTCY
jgi:hypothetical protein